MKDAQITTLKRFEGNVRSQTRVQYGAEPAFIVSTMHVDRGLMRGGLSYQTIVFREAADAGLGETFSVLPWEHAEENAMGVHWNAVGLLADGKNREVEALNTDPYIWESDAEGGGYEPAGDSGLFD